MDTYLIEADGADRYGARVIRANGISHSARGFTSRCEAQAWVNEHRRFERTVTLKMASASSGGRPTTSR